MPSKSYHALALKVITIKKSKYMKLIMENINIINLSVHIFLLKLINSNKLIKDTIINKNNQV